MQAYVQLEITDYVKMWCEQKRGPRAARRVGHWFSYHILTSSVIYNWKYLRQNGIYLFYTITEDFSAIQC